MIMQETRHLSEYGKRLRFVCQTGGNNPKVKWDANGLESVMFATIMFKRMPLTPKGLVNVFDYESGLWLGQIRYDNDLILRKFQANETLYFNDLYKEEK